MERSSVATAGEEDGEGIAVQQKKLQYRDYKRFKEKYLYEVNLNRK